ncbi:hypothetical protein HDV05_008735 [Chytridiales sp. JEL 0842]|nr:hypothetical protein HDV05_008735 [Chytridiales sp. JEL 0842]
MIKLPRSLPALILAFLAFFASLAVQAAPVSPSSVDVVKRADPCDPIVYVWFFRVWTVYPCESKNVCTGEPGSLWCQSPGGAPALVRTTTRAAAARSTTTTRTSTTARTTTTAGRTTTTTAKATTTTAKATTTTARATTWLRGKWLQCQQCCFQIPTPTSYNNRANSYDTKDCKIDVQIDPSQSKAYEFLLGEVKGIRNTASDNSVAKTVVKYLLNSTPTSPTLTEYGYYVEIYKGSVDTAYKITHNPYGAHKGCALQNPNVRVEITADASSMVMAANTVKTFRFKLRAAAKTLAAYKL